jgi:hypothetical protein
MDEWVKECESFQKWFADLGVSDSKLYKEERIKNIEVNHE